MNVLLAAVLLVQDKSAEETFKRIEDSILHAKTISVTIRRAETEAWGEEKRTMLLKDGNKFRIESQGSIKGKAYETLEICDGARMYTKAKAELEPAPKEDNWFRVELSRLGHATTALYSSARSQGCV